MALAAGLVTSLPSHAHGHSAAAATTSKVDELNKMRAALQSLVGPLPGIALSPALTLGGLTGIALVCRKSGPHSLGGACDVPLLQKIGQSASLPLFVFLAAFSLVCFLANSGKVQGLLGKVLKLVETVPVLLAYFLLARTILGEARTTSLPMLTMNVSFPTASMLVVAVTSALAALMCVRLAVDVLVWLSPFPLVDLMLEICQRTLAIGFLALSLWRPVAATVVACTILIVVLLTARWGLRAVIFGLRSIAEPLLAHVFDWPEPDLVDDGVLAYLRDGERPALAVRATALGVRALPARVAGGLIRTSDGVFFVARRWLRAPRLVRLDGGQRQLQVVRCSLWLEVRVTVGPAVISRVALTLSMSALRGRLCAALEADDCGDEGAVAFARKILAV